MNTHNPLLSDRDGAPTDKTDQWSHVLIWVLLAVAALLLVGFTVLVDDITQRGELRRVQQRESGSWVLQDNLPIPDVDVLRLLSITGEKLAGR